MADKVHAADRSLCQSRLQFARSAWEERDREAPSVRRLQLGRLETLRKWQYTERRDAATHNYRASTAFCSFLVTPFSRDTIATTSPLHERLKLSQRCFLLRQNRLGSGFCKHELSNRTPGLRHLVLMISRQPLIKIQFPLGQSQLIQVSISLPKPVMSHFGVRIQPNCREETGNGLLAFFSVGIKRAQFKMGYSQFWVQMDRFLEQ